MTSSDENYKRSIKSAHLRQMKKMRSREERKLLDENSKRRGPGRKSKPRRQRWTEEEEEDFTSFERMRPAQQLDLEKAKSAVHAQKLEVVDDADREALDVVVSVARDRVAVSDGGDTHTVLLDENSPQVAVGDLVLLEKRADCSFRLVGAAARQTILSRPDPGNPRKELVLAANVDVTVIVASVAEPAFRPGLVDRFLISIQRGGITPILAVNKMDLLDSEEAARTLEEALAPFEELGLEVFRVSAANGSGLAELRARLQGETCVLVGHSGVGKSTILNGIDPERERSTGSGREFDGKGRHTTTASELSFLPGGTRLIDTPGIRTLGLWKIDPADLVDYFPDFSDFTAHCRFRNCSHIVEPDCGVKAAVEEGDLTEARYDVYVRFHGELSSAM